MIVDINQKKISIGAEYKIFVNEQEVYSATKEFFRFLSEIYLFKMLEGKARYQIKKEWSWLKPSYNIITHDNQILHFRTVSLWKLHYECIDGSNLYEIFGHRGRKYSVYKDGVQVAWWDKESVSWFNGDNYRLIANDDCDIELLICFCLIIDNTSSRNDEGNTVTIDFGNIGFQAKKFDPDWKPVTK